MTQSFCLESFEVQDWLWAMLNAMQTASTGLLNEEYTTISRQTEQIVNKECTWQCLGVLPVTFDPPQLFAPLWWSHTSWLAKIQCILLTNHLTRSCISPNAWLWSRKEGGLNAGDCGYIKNSLQVQEEMLNEIWSKETLNFSACQPVHEDNGHVLFMGPRVKMGIYEGQPTRICPHTTTGRADYFGPFVNRSVIYQAKSLPICSNMIGRARQVYNQVQSLVKQLHSRRECSS